MDARTKNTWKEKEKEKKKEKKEGEDEEKEKQMSEKGREIARV